MAASSVRRASQSEGKPSLVDMAEEALRSWLATGRHRPGERLPPEQELSAQLGISRGTLRTALRRLEDTGEIVRRQGTGTYVGRAGPDQRSTKGLEKLVSYTELARRRGVELALGEARGRPRSRSAPRRARWARPSRPTRRVQHRRSPASSCIDGRPGAWMRDVVHPERRAAAPPRSCAHALARGEMVLDQLLKAGLPVAYTRAHIKARLVTRRDPVGSALAVGETTAALEIEHVTCDAEGAPLEHSVDVFLPRSLDLHVMRWLEDVPPGAGDRARRGARRFRLAHIPRPVGSIPATVEP